MLWMVIACGEESNSTSIKPILEVFEGFPTQGALAPPGRSPGLH